nr:1,4-dihydroxy-2-naphthoate octaprenyltransferase [uncultured Porphyromonas sp.]
MQQSASSPSKLSLWIGLTRPKTLFSGLSSVLVAIFYAASLGAIDILRTLLLVVVAVAAQIASNIANDLIDHSKGADTDERKGPLRPLSRGLISEREVRLALYLSLAVLLTSGLWLIALSSWWLLLVGLAVVLGLFAYSGGPYPLSYHGWGDAAVLVFFGWVPTVTSFYILRGYVLDQTLWQLATAIGLSSVNILVVNNYRDVAEDSKAGKRTLIVRMGQDFAPRLYLTCGLLSMGLLYPIYSFWGMLLLLPYVLLFSQTHRALQTSRGAELNSVLARTARNVFLLALLIGAMLWLKP